MAHPARVAALRCIKNRQAAAAIGRGMIRGRFTKFRELNQRVGLI
jgi:hypothetical protein